MAICCVAAGWVRWLWQFVVYRNQVRADRIRCWAFLAVGEQGYGAGGQCRHVAVYTVLLQGFGGQGLIGAEVVAFRLMAAHAALGEQLHIRALRYVGVVAGRAVHGLPALDEALAGRQQLVLVAVHVHFRRFLRERHRGQQVFRQGISRFEGEGGFLEGFEAGVAEGAHIQLPHVAQGIYGDHIAGFLHLRVFRMVFHVLRGRAVAALAVYAGYHFPLFELFHLLHAGYLVFYRYGGTVAAEAGAGDNTVKLGVICRETGAVGPAFCRYKPGNRQLEVLPLLPIQICLRLSAGTDGDVNRLFLRLAAVGVDGLVEDGVFFFHFYGNVVPEMEGIIGCGVRGF